MGKSIRSKVKRHFRAKKREEGTYAAIEAARLERISSKLAVIKSMDKAGNVPMDKIEEAQLDDQTDDVQPKSSDLEDQSKVKKISTHGPRNSRRELWRASKGMAPRRKPTRVNRQGIIAAKKKAGRAKRRR